MVRPLAYLPLRGLRKLKDPTTVLRGCRGWGATLGTKQFKEEEKNDFTEIKRALYTAIGTDMFVEYQLFVGHRLLSDEKVDIYLSDL